MFRPRADGFQLTGSTWNAYDSATALLLLNIIWPPHDRVFFFFTLSEYTNFVWLSYNNIINNMNEYDVSVVSAHTA